MIKNNLKKTLIFGILFIFTSCSEELYEDTNLNKSKISVQEKKFDKLIKEKDFNRLIRNISGNSIVSRSIFENQNGFTISNNNVKIIQTDSIVSYTMLIERDIVSDSTVFENLVIQENNFNTTKTALLYKYTSNGATPTQHNSFAFNGVIEKNLLEYSNFNKASYDNTIQTDGCSAIVLMCNESSSGGIGNEHVATGICNSIHHLYFKVVEAICPDNGGSSGGGSSDGDASGSGGYYDYGDPYSSGGGTNGGTGSSYQNTTDTNQDVVTSPVKTGLNGEETTPCDRIKKNTQKTNFKTNLAFLMNPDNFNLNFEYGFGEVNGFTNAKWLSPAPGDPNSSLSPVPGLKNFTHIHPKKTMTDSNGDTYDGLVKIFSPGDLLILLTTCYNSNGATPEEGFSIMLSNDIHYAMQLSAPLTPNEFNTLNNKFAEFRKNYNKLCADLVVITDVDERNEALQKMFLEEMNKLGIGNNLSLFSGNITNPTTNPITNWTKLSLTNGTIVPEPCN